MLAFLILLLVGHHAVTRPGLLTTPRKPSRWPVAHHPHLAHFLPYLTGDSLRAITRAGRLRRLGRVWGIDQNGNRSAQRTVWILHWGRYRWQFPFIATPKGLRRVPRSWPKQFHDLTDDQAAQLRTVTGRRPYRARTHMHRAAEVGIPWCLEGKGRMAGADWDRLTAEAVASGATVVYMTLSSWPDWQQAVREAAAHGWAVAVLPRTPRPANWAEFHAETGCQVWGSWR